MAPVRGAGVVVPGCASPCSTVMRGLDPRIFAQPVSRPPSRDPGRFGTAGVYGTGPRLGGRGTSCPKALGGDDREISGPSPGMTLGGGAARCVTVFSTMRRPPVDSRFRGNDEAGGVGLSKCRATSSSVMRGLDPRISAVRHTRTIADPVSRSPSRDPGSLGTAEMYGTGPRLEGRGTSCLKAVGGRGREIPGSSPG